ncbi:MAG TPA: hypothetical protein VG095_09155, partial [Chthoniobacterales bacterium]|nr:hypothetical protein [Chthoniobacterales bacterium]
MSATAAVLVCDSDAGNLKIAGLTVLDRMVVAASRAGCTPITLVSPGARNLERASALRIEIRFADEMPASTERTLMMSGALLIEPGDLRRVIAAHGQLTTAA